LSNLLLLPLAPMGHRPGAITFQVLLSFASISNSLHLLPKLLLSFSKSLLNVFFGLSFFPRALWVPRQSLFCYSTLWFSQCVAHPSLFSFLDLSSILTCPVFTHKRSFVIVFINAELIRSEDVYCISAAVISGL
jgi:hypothetical protein